MTTIVAIQDVPALGISRGQIVTDDSNVVATAVQATLKSTAYVNSIISGNYAKSFVNESLTGNVAAAPSPATLFISSLAQAITSQASTLGLTVSQILTALAAQLGVSLSAGTVAPTLTALTLSSLTATAGSIFSAAIAGQTTGSSITASSSDGTVMTVSGSTLYGTFSAAGSPVITLVETLAGAMGSPKSSTATVTVAAAASIPANNNLHPSFFAFGLMGAATS